MEKFQLTKDGQELTGQSAVGRTFQAGNFSRDLFHFKVTMAAVRKTDRRLWAEGRVAAVVIQTARTGVTLEGTEKSARAGQAGRGVSEEETGGF